MTRLLYENFECQIMLNKLIDPFEIKQGCVLSPILFSLAGNWLMQRTTEEYKRGIGMSFSETSRVILSIILVRYRIAPSSRKSEIGCG
uniref:Reverse transcriptase domain-containing protein n=1 Tax=Octopus bimaculoides TaxID=37653 RepID=A0A0L8HZ56_OCTBM